MAHRRATGDGHKVAALIRAVAKENDVPMPSASAIARSVRDAGLPTDSTEWSRTGVRQFIRTLFPTIGVSKPKDVVTTEVRMRESRYPVHYLLSIDSNDRDKARFECPNEFEVQLGDPQRGGIPRTFVDVQFVDLVSVVVPKHTVDGDNVDDFPYIVLEIPELGGIYDATNTRTSRAFAKLRFADDLGAYREYRTTDKGERFSKRFNPVRTINRLTIRFCRPDGRLYDFGTKVKRRPRYATVVHEGGDADNKTKKRRPMYFDGERWLPVQERGARAKDQSTADDEAACCPAPTCLDHLPSSNVSIVLRVTCLEMHLDTTHLHHQ